MAEKWGGTAWSSFLSADIIATAPSFVNIAEVGSMGRPWAGRIVEKWPKIEFLGKCRENGVVIAWSSFTFTDIIAMVPSDINFVYKDRYGAMGSLISRHQGFKRPKMAKKGILSHFSPFVPAYGRPVNPTSTFTKMLSLVAVSLKSMERKLLQAIINPFSRH